MGKHAYYYGSMRIQLAVLLTATIVGSWVQAGSGLDTMALGDALAIGHDRSGTTRQRFHAEYRVPVGVAPVDYVEVVTPFRAVVLAAEARMRSGQPALGLKEAQAIVAATGERTSLQLELTFHPMNTYVGVPAFDVTVVNSGTARGMAMERVPRFGPRVDGTPLGAAPTPGGVRTPGTSAPLTGATLIGPLPQDLDPAGRVEVQLRDGPRLLVRIPLELGRVR